MQNLFEVYLLNEAISADQWRTLYNSIHQYAGKLSKFDIIFMCTDNVVRYFVRSEQNLAALSTNIDGLLLRPVDATELNLPEQHRKQRFVSFVTGGSLLDLKEKYHVKKSLDLQYVVFSIRIINDGTANVSANMYFLGAGDAWFHAKKKMLKFPAHLLAVDFAGNTRYMHRQTPRYLNIEKSMHMLVSQNLNAVFEVDTFPYFSNNYYLNITNYEFDKHSFIIGASGSGKSKFISLFVDRLQQTALNMNYRVIVIDPHASLAEDFKGMPSSKVITFSDESTELFASAGADTSAATELTATLFKSLLADQYTPRLDRTLRFALFVLFTAQNMSLDMLKRFLTEIELRNQVLDHVREFVPTNIAKFFGGDFNEIRTQYYNEVISPVVSLVDEMQLQPALVGNGNVSLAKTVNDNFLTVFSLNKVKMGEKVVKTVAGLLIQQIFLLAQSHAFNQKVIMIIDEVSVVQTPALASILAEARKYNLSVFLTQQYFGQIDDDLKAAIFANVYNYYVFRTSEEDARALEGNLKLEIPKELIEQENARGIKEQDLRVRMLTELHPRECIARLLAKGQLNPCIKLRTMDAPQRAAVTTANPASLTLYEQVAETINLPSKFVETASPAIAAPAQPAGAAPPPGSAPTAAMATPTMSMNLSEIMAMQSSGRKPVNKRKETT
ncbi:MAG: hypothetical protein JWO41_567 [Candidatus Saccharibacteria bacterium]|nr:hypothetical protein [Candidatus Saccharibacteria bacterium]